MADPKQTIQDWYTEQLHKYYDERYRSYISGAEEEDKSNELGRSAVYLPREEHEGLPDEVREAYAFYRKHFTEEDIGSARIWRFPVRKKTYYAVLVTTDGDDGYAEIYDDKGELLGAARRYIEVIAWGSRDWLRDQATHPSDLPPELQDAHERTLWKQPVEEPEPAEAPAPAGVSWLAEVHNADGDEFEEDLLVTHVTMDTDEGPVTVPAEDVLQIDFAVRKGGRRRKKAPAQDIVTTVDKELTGTIQGDRWEAQFPGYTTNRMFVDTARIVKRITLQDAAGAFGTQREFRLRGRSDGVVYGSNPYTLDSCLATAAVHAGVLREGQPGSVRVEIIPSPADFEGTKQHGITSESWEEANEEGAFRITNAAN